MSDVTVIFKNLGSALTHLMAQASVDKAQEAEIKATIKQLNDFEAGINDLIDARVAAALANQAPAEGGGDYDTRLKAIEEGLESLGHAFTDSNQDPVTDEPGEDTTTGADTQNGDQGDTQTGTGGDDTINAGAGGDSIDPTAPAEPAQPAPAADAAATTDVTATAGDQAAG